MLSLFFTATTAYFTTLRVRTYLQPFQQEEYDNLRFIRWWKEKRAIDRLASIGLLVALPFGWLQPQVPLLTAAMWFIYRARREPDPTQSGKKTLVLTPRAQRLWWLASAFAAFGIAIIAAIPASAMVKVGLTLAWLQLIPLTLVLANLALWPLQQWQNRRYITEATAILARLNPTIIGLTGSFGKTSTKYFLNHILSSHSPSLATPGSVNTPLGIARVIRENLQPQHQYFLAEMGAYAPGSIAGLCRLAPPAISCITAVGHAHYERFKTLATVAKAKFEIAEATLARGGMCVLSIDGIPDDLWQPRVANSPTSYRLVTTRAEHLRDNDYYIKEATESPAGLTLTLQHKGKQSTFTAPIHGKVQAANLAVAFALAHELGVPPATITSAMASIKPAPYRLNIQQVGSQTIIDDSYNANPAGFAAALETLSLLATSGASSRRRVVVTPGMVELGTAHDAEHARLGTLAATHADVILAINPSRIPTFTQAVRTSSGAVLHTFASLAEARKWMQSNTFPDDVILIANDLPDRYEARWTL